MFYLERVRSRMILHAVLSSVDLALLVMESHGIFSSTNKAYINLYFIEHNLKVSEISRDLQKLYFITCMTHN